MIASMTGHIQGVEKRVVACSFLDNLLITDLAYLDEVIKRLLSK